ncbi:DUF1499 domain-containing protein [Nitrococcus mobilis]|uniref:DUF1499 domain-containing protein n=1 Tax=Nitrococcus mobilis Nb-231 TaxID=314278 RepID=A4BUN7_9GAMM|nr:DUF1499 domain-containing protein [Nitrococcus mobilis]EAR20603.1 hypothetical protein NB231_07387 [Nitrococcus mobilis Nb-231]
MQHLIQLLLALLLVGVIAALAVIAYNHPPLTSSPGLLTRLSTYLTRHVAQTEPMSAYPERRLHVYRRPAQAVLEAAVAAARANDWQIQSIDSKHHHLHAVAVTPLWRFKDDVEVWVKTTEDGGSALYLRSASRVGIADFGANTARLVHFRQQIEQRL